MDTENRRNQIVVCNNCAATKAGEECDDCTGAGCGCSCQTRRPSSPPERPYASQPLSLNRKLNEVLAGPSVDISNAALKAALVGDELADLGYRAGGWENRFVAAIARELLERRGNQ